MQKKQNWRVKARFSSRVEAESNADLTRSQGLHARIKPVGKHTFDYYVLTLQ